MTERHAAAHPGEVAGLETQRQQEIIDRARRSSMYAQHHLAQALIGDQYGKGRSAGRVMEALQPVPEGMSADQIADYYHQLAVGTLQTAMAAPRQGDDSIALLGEEIRRRHVVAATRAGTTNELAKSEADYNRGAAMLLIDLGFVLPVHGLDRSGYGSAVFNPDIRWTLETDPENGTNRRIQHAWLPFNPENELHRILVPDTLQRQPNIGIEFEVSPGSDFYGGHVAGEEYMVLRYTTAPPKNP